LKLFGSRGRRNKGMLNLTLSIGLSAILLVPIGEIDKKVIQVLKDDLNKVFKKPVAKGKGMPEPDYAYDHKRK
jgi:hypothetical protein